MRLQDCEKIASSTHPPNKDSTLRLQIADTWEESREEVEDDKAHVQVYLDGLGLEGMVGAVAVLFRDGQEVWTIRYQLGPLTCHTTYGAEVVGVILAAELINRECAAHTATIRLDNQAVIQVLGGCSAKLAQYLLDLVHKACKGWLTDRQCNCRQLTISWVSGHNGIQGNERADSEARAAACNRLSPEKELPEVLLEQALPCSLTTMSGAFKESMWDRWKFIWVKSPQKGGWTK